MSHPFSKNLDTMPQLVKNIKMISHLFIYFNENCFMQNKYAY